MSQTTLKTHNGTYGARILECSSETDMDVFMLVLKHELSKTHPHAIYVDIPAGRADLITVVCVSGFKYHQTKHTETVVPYLVYYKWCSDEKDRVPSAPSTTTGAHVIVWRTINNKSKLEVLAVREGKMWGLVGGSGQPAELLHRTALREAEEEVELKTFQPDPKTCLRLVRLKSELVENQFGLHNDVSVVLALEVDQDWTPHCDQEEIEAYRWVSEKDLVEHGSNFRSNFIKLATRVFKSPHTLPPVEFTGNEMSVML